MISFRSVKQAVLALACLVALMAAAGAQTNPFGRGAPQGSAAPEAKAGTPAAAPSLIERWYGALRRWQSELTNTLAGEVRAYKDGDSLRPMFGLLLISFLYGVAHAVGPGHGKVATAAYFGANRARVAQGLGMSGLIGLVQALSAILFVGAFALIFQVSQTETIRHVAYLEVASYALIALVGLWIAWGGVVGRGCGHAHGPAHHHHDHAGHDHHGHHHGHEHGHGHGHGHALAPATAGPAPVHAEAVAGWRSMVPVALASGIRPCTGAILVLLFTLTQGIFEIGVLATLVMSFGTFLVVAAIGLAAIYLRRAATRSGGGNERLANLAQRAVGIVGGLVVFGFGALFLLATLPQIGIRL